MRFSFISVVMDTTALRITSAVKASMPVSVWAGAAIGPRTGLGVGRISAAVSGPQTGLESATLVEMEEQTRTRPRRAGGGLRPAAGAAARAGRELQPGGGGPRAESQRRRRAERRLRRQLLAGASRQPGRRRNLEQSAGP